MSSSSAAAIASLFGLSRSTSLSRVPSLEKDEAAGFARAGRLSQETDGLSGGAETSGSPWDRAKCKGQSHPVTRGVLLLIFNLPEPCS